MRYQRLIADPNCEGIHSVSRSERNARAPLRAIMADCGSLTWKEALSGLETARVALVI